LKHFKLTEAEEKLSTVFDQVNNSLAALIAHVAATAHAAAACVASSHFYSSFYPQPEGKAPINIIEQLAPVPIKTQVETASTKFASLKDKISNFFNTMSKKEKSVDESAKSGLNLLISNYVDENEEETINEGDDLVELNINNKKKESDQESDSESDLEIVTTSEIKTGLSNRNYLLPSLKASYFPLQASLQMENKSNSLSVNDHNTKNLKDFLYK